MIMVPAPDLTSKPGPVMSIEKVVLEGTLRVSVAPPSLRVPEPVRLDGEAPAPLRSRTEPAAIERAFPPGNAAGSPNFNVPALTVTGPVKLFVPVRATVPVPDWVSAPAPVMLPAKVRESVRLKV